MKTSKNNLRRRGLALFLALVMCVGMLQTTAFAAEEDSAADDGIMTVTDISDEIFGSDDSAEADTGTVDETATADAGTADSASDEASSTTVVDEESGNVTVTDITTDVWDEGDTSGSSTTTTETTTDPDGNIVGEKVETTGQETTKNPDSETIKEETVLPGNVTGEITTKPNKTGSITTEAGSVGKPDVSGEDWTVNDDGAHVKTEKDGDTETVTTVTESEDESGNKVYTTETVVTTTTTTESNVKDAPEAGTVENEDGSRTTTTVEKDADGNVTSYTQVTEVLGADGTVLSSVTKTVTGSGKTTIKSFTKTTKTVTVPSDAAGSLNVTMGQVTAGDKHGALHTNGLDIPMDGFTPVDKDFDDLDGSDLVFVAGVGIKSKHDLTVMYGSNTNAIVNKGRLGVSQYVVVDKDGNKHVIYCADMSVPADSDVKYYMTNTEDADYYTDSKNHGAGKNDLPCPDGGEHLREIATNGYWGTAEGMGSLDKMIQDLLQAKADGNSALENVSEDEIRALTHDLAMSATQAAIWRYGNSMNKTQQLVGSINTMVQDSKGLDYDSATHTFTKVTETIDPETGKTVIETKTWTIKAPPGIDLSELITVKRDENNVITSVTYPKFINAYIKLIPDGWLNGSNSMHTLISGASKDSYENQMATAVYNWLCGLKSDENNTTDLIQPSDIVEAVTNIKDTIQDSESGETKYEADVSFVLTVEPSRLNGDLLVKVYDVDTGELIETRRVAGECKDGEKMAGVTQTDKGMVYTIDGLTLSNGQTIKLNLVGSQDVEKGAYLITAKGGEDKSQTFVGVEEGSREVDLSFTLKLDVTGAVVDTTEKIESGEEKTWTEETEMTYSYYELELPDPDPDPDPDPTPTPDPGDDDDDDDDDDPTPTPSRTPDPTPDPDPEIPDVPTPLAPAPETPVETSEDVIEEEDVPLAELPEEEEVEIPEEDVPLAEVPQTGDISGMWYAMTIAAACGLIAIRFIKTRKEEM